MLSLTATSIFDGLFFRIRNIPVSFCFPLQMYFNLFGYYAWLAGRFTFPVAVNITTTTFMEHVAAERMEQVVCLGYVLHPHKSNPIHTFTTIIAAKLSELQDYNNIIQFET